MRQIILSPKDIERFWSKVAVADADDCWEWQGSQLPVGYGKFTLSIDGVKRFPYAHRISFIIATGSDPAPLLVCHTCDNPSCVNPSHLFSGTYTDNARDREGKGRGRKPSPRREIAPKPEKRKQEKQEPWVPFWSFCEPEITE
jgi:hypothetical protein